MLVPHKMNEDCNVHDHAKNKYVNDAIYKHILILGKKNMDTR